MEPTAVYTRPEQLGPVAGEWRELAARTPELSYFTTPDWVLGWWETFGDGHAAEIAVWRDRAGRLEAVVALARAGQRIHPRLPVRLPVWTNLGSGVGGADHCGWPVAADRVQDVRDWIAERTAGAPLVLSNLDPSTGRPFVPAEARRVAVSRCPRLVVPEAGEAIGSSRNLRKQLRAYTRKLLDQGVTFRWIPPGKVSEADLETVFRLHEARWSIAAETSSFDRSRAALHRRLIARAGPGHGPAMLVAERDGHAVGVSYGFLWGEVYAAFQSGWEPEWAASHLGTVMDGETIRAAQAGGARIYDFLRGAEAYKYRFGAADRVDETWLVARGGSGRLLDLRYRLKARLEPPDSRGQEAAAATGG
jgi:CelD/BcsL family acetyltransferase involved in cellulose biosynthesis